MLAPVLLYTPIFVYRRSLVGLRLVNGARMYIIDRRLLNLNTCRRNLAHKGRGVMAHTHSWQLHRSQWCRAPSSVRKAKAADAISRARTAS
eukprot:6200165-Pleurochrysis_carterae.AAC.1